MVKDAPEASLFQLWCGCVSTRRKTTNQSELWSSAKHAGIFPTETDFASAEGDERLLVLITFSQPLQWTIFFFKYYYHYHDYYYYYYSGCLRRAAGSNLQRAAAAPIRRQLPAAAFPLVSHYIRLNK